MNCIVKTMFGLVYLFSAAMAGTISDAYCQPFSTDAETGTASCHGGDGNGSVASATATATYGNLTATASSSWDFSCSIGPSCEPDAASSAEFVQTATFTGLLGTGTLRFNSVHASQVPGFYPSVYFAVNGQKYWGIFPGPLSIPITFDTPVTLDGYASIYASDASNQFGFLSVGGFSILDSTGAVVQTWNSLANMDAVTYSVISGTATNALAASAPEPSLALLAGLVILITAGRTAFRIDLAIV